MFDEWTDSFHFPASNSTYLKCCLKIFLKYIYSITISCLSSFVAFIKFNINAACICLAKEISVISGRNSRLVAN